MQVVSRAIDSRAFAPAAFLTTLSGWGISSHGVSVRRIQNWATTTKGELLVGIRAMYGNTWATYSGVCS